MVATEELSVDVKKERQTTRGGKVLSGKGARMRGSPQFVGKSLHFERRFHIEDYGGEGREKGLKKKRGGEGNLSLVDGGAST